MTNKKIIGRLAFILLLAVWMSMRISIFGEAAETKVSNPEKTAEDTLWDCVYFGTYYEDAGTDVKKPVKWRVLSVKGQDAFLISDQILDAGAFHDAYEAVSWKESYIRAWLNSEFYECAFTEEEKQAVIQTKVITEQNPDYGTPGGTDTEDFVYLLSSQEAVDSSYGFSKSGYYGDSRIAKNTAYTALGGTQGRNMRAEGKSDWWWLRSPGIHGAYAAQVMDTGYVANYGSTVNYEKCGIRPVLHLDLSKSAVWSYAGKTNIAGDEIPVKEQKPDPPQKVKAPKKAALQSVKKSGKKILVKWKKISCDGYQVLISTDKKFKKNKKSYYVNSAKTVKKTIKPWKGNKTYYVKVRAYRKSGKTKVYGTYSTVKKIKYNAGKKGSISGKSSVEVGKKIRLKVKGISGTVKWSVNKKKLASISSGGVLKAKKKGKVIVRAKVKGITLKKTVTIKKLYLRKGKEVKAAAADENIIGILGEGHSIRLKKNGGDTGICIVSEDGSIVFENPKPVELRVVDAAFKQEEKIESGYLTVSNEGNAWVGKAEVKSQNGSIFEVMDSYIPDTDGVRMEREVSVINAAGEDQGFASYVSMEASISTASSYEDVEYFIPAMLYKDTENVAGYAAFSKNTFYGEEVMAKETRAGLPMVMIRQKATGQTLAIAHIADDISDKASNETNSQKVRCDSLCRYGAVGVVKRQGVAAAFRYPYLEAPNSYATGNGKNVCYHPVQEGETQHYSLNLFAASAEDYNRAMIACYNHHYKALDPVIADVDVQKAYQVVMQDVSSYVQERGSGIGLPFAAYVDDGSVFIDGGGNEAVNFQMGFIGMQIPLAYQMMRYGQQYGDSETYQKGIDIMNFWAGCCQTDSGVVKVWFDTNGFRPYPPFLRIMTDGMEGMLDACQIIEKSGHSAADTERWRQTVFKYADFLVEKQNEDGSFYRAYDYQGNAFTEKNNDGLIGDNNTQGESKLNTAVPIRFLIRMYEWSQDSRYLDAAKRAGAFVLENLYENGKYVGGTADNPNTVDKEAGMYAVYAYSALYGATGEERYLKAMEQAVVYAMSWVYTYKFSAINTEDVLAGIPTTLGMNDGLSFIATGHSAVDNMIAYLYYEIFKLYVWTGDETYYDMSHLIQNNTKQAMDLNGKYGYARPSFMIEATGIADLVFGTAGGRGIWLPWISCANAEPISEMEDTFGTADVSSAKALGSEQLRKALETYGAGGHRYD